LSAPLADLPSLRPRLPPAPSRLQDKAGYSPTYPDALAAAHDWLQTQLPALEAAARAAHVPVCRVHCEGPTEAQMTSLLIAATSS